MLLLLCTLLSCSSPNECDYWDPRDTVNRRDFDLMEHASDVVVGRIEELRTTGRARPACRQASLLLEPALMKVAVENVLAGGLNPSIIEVHYFQLSPANSNGYSGPPLFQPRKGERRVFFLDRSSSGLRLAGDVYDYTIRNEAGYHLTLNTVAANRWEVLAKTLLTLGDGYNESAMASFIPRYSRLIDHFDSRLLTAELLRGLVQSAPAPIRIAACLHLAAEYPGQYGCLEKLLSADLLSGVERERVAAALQLQKKHNENLLTLLARDPLSALSDGAPLDNVVRLKDEFLMLAQDPDSEIAHLACSALIRFWNEQPSQCNPGSRGSIE